jgi:hypothetical protein
MVAQIGYSVAERSRGQVTLCAVCTMHVETRSGEWFDLKTIRTVFAGLTLKPVVMVSHRFGPQNRW